VPEAFGELHIPYGCVARIEAPGVSSSLSLSSSSSDASGYAEEYAQTAIIIWCKDLRVVCISFNQREPALVDRIVKAVRSMAFYSDHKKRGSNNSSDVSSSSSGSKVSLPSSLSQAQQGSPLPEEQQLRSVQSSSLSSPVPFDPVAAIIERGRERQRRSTVRTAQPIFAYEHFSSSRRNKNNNTAAAGSVSPSSSASLLVAEASLAEAATFVDGWSLYNPQSEFERQGVLLPIAPVATGSSSSSSSSSRTSGGDSAGSASAKKNAIWYLVDNRDFKKSPTYPARFVMPVHLSDADFKKSAKFRSKKR
jgi:hypothetical protein